MPKKLIYLINEKDIMLSKKRKFIISIMKTIH